MFADCNVVLGGAETPARSVPRRCWSLPSVDRAKTDSAAQTGLSFARAHVATVPAPHKLAHYNMLLCAAQVIHAQPDPLERAHMVVCNLQSRSSRQWARHSQRGGFY